MGNQAERGQGLAGTSMQRGMSNQGEMGGGVSRSGGWGGYKYAAGAAGTQGMGVVGGGSRSGALAAKYPHPHGAHPLKGQQAMGHAPPAIPPRTGGGGDGAEGVGGGIGAADPHFQHAISAALHKGGAQGGGFTAGWYGGMTAEQMMAGGGYGYYYPVYPAGRGGGMRMRGGIMPQGAERAYGAGWPGPMMPDGVFPVFFPASPAPGVLYGPMTAGMDMTGMYAMHSSYAPAPLAEVYQESEATEVEAGGYKQSPVIAS